jgi:acetyl-CoA carboxylase biotin carboxyl carrier protein
MDVREIQKLIRIVEKSQINELEIEVDAYRIRVVKNAQVLTADMGTAVPQQVVPIAPPPATPPPVAQAPSESPSPSSFTGAEVHSPMVGTFYSAPAPDAAPYVKVGDMVSKGQVLCIVEAMKLMNEIESDVAGKVVEIAVENAQPVEYNQVLFRIEPA